MIIMQVSLYPLGEKDIEGRLNIFWASLRSENIDFKVTPLSTIIWAEDEGDLFDLVFKAYKKVREKGNTVMITTVTTGTDKEINRLLNYHLE